MKSGNSGSRLVACRLCAREHRKKAGSKLNLKRKNIFSLKILFNEINTCAHRFF